MDIKEELLKMQDLEYKNFHKKLMPTIDEQTIIGVRTPLLRDFARTIAKTAEAEEFITRLPHEFYEENNLHAFLIEKIADYDKAMEETERFLPFIDNWATCDMFAPKAFKKDKERTLAAAKRWISSDKIYTIRYGIGTFMRFYLDEDFKEEYLSLVANVKSEEYYVKMMIAWYFATALAKQFQSAIKYIKGNFLDEWTKNKAIQKAIESRRISKETKEYLKTLKRPSK